MRAKLAAGIGHLRQKSGAFFSAVHLRLNRAPWRRILAIGGGILGVLIVVLAALLTFADWNALRSPIARTASGMFGRQIEISGDLEVHPWSFTPRISVAGLRIGDPNWGKREGVSWGEEPHFFAYVPQMQTQIELWPLLTGDLVLRSLDLTKPDIRLARDEKGRSNWSKDPSIARSPLRLPMIRRFTIVDGKLELSDKKRRVLLQANLNSQEVQRNGAKKAFTLTGEGQLNRAPFNLQLSGGALVNVNRGRPYKFNFDLKAGSTHIVAAGALRRPFDLARYSADITATGDDLANLYDIIGLTLPNTPPYRLTTTLTRQARGYSLDDISGRVGDSDLNGSIKVRTGRERPFVEAKITSKSLDFDDLAAVLGAPPSTGAGEAASPGQRAEAARLKAQGRLLPDARLNLDRVRNMDAHLWYAADRIVDSPMPLRGASVDLSIDRGVLKMSPVTFILPRGQLAGSVRIDARKSVPDVNLDARITGAHVEDFIKTKNAIEGLMLARIKLQGRGATVRAAAASANGSLTIVMPRGQIRRAFAELTGVNVLRGLGLLLTDDQSQAQIRCGVASFNVARGIARADVLLFDTEDVLIAGEGGINLDQESFDIKMQGHPKEVRLVRVAAPVTISGRWRSPKLGVDATKVLGQAGFAGIVASLLNPLAALLPFVDAGLAEDADCKALLVEHSPKASKKTP